MQIQLRWEDSVTGEHWDVTFTLPVALGSKPEAMPNRLNNQPVDQLLLQSKVVSRYHALIALENDQLVITDKSTNGSYLNGKWFNKSHHSFQSGDCLKIGPYVITLTLVAEVESEGTEVMPHESSVFVPSQVAQARGGSAGQNNQPDSGMFFEPETDLLEYRLHKKPQSLPLPNIFGSSHVAIAEIKRIILHSNYEEKDYVAIGGGMGSFAWVDTIRISGVKSEQIRVIGRGDSKPYHRYRLLCRNSQIPEDYERIRSNSDSCPDNIWGWPGYALREAWRDIVSGNLSHAFKCLWQVFAEPLLSTDTYTPIAGDVYTSLDREAKRINWKSMWRAGDVKLIRKTDDGRYVIIYSLAGSTEDEYQILVAKYINLAIGYASVKFLPDLLEYRETTGDRKSVVNAYENHEHVYQYLKKHGGIVIIRGRGIVASRIIQRLNEVRQQTKNNQVTIIHIMQSPNPEGAKFGQARRYVENNWEFQPFNWPKAAWGGDLRKILATAKPPERYKMLQDWGGTTTADRSDWRRLIRNGLHSKEQWYQIYFGRVEKVERNAEGKLNILIAGSNIKNQIRLDIPAADFIIDATGLDANPIASPLINDLIQRYHIPLNSSGRIEVTNEFEIKDMRSKKVGRIFAAGSMTLGGSYAPVDSFLGLQYAAQRSAEALARIGAPGIKYLEGIGSFWQWIKWATNQQP
ncbi:FHA domain-containing protein [Fortiea contorta]|uniref:FHA domain-containing protein n=1 Tax=Fortiea contorta TaxID=1892405 RepID=UPI000345D49D|nr:FHA domain-containing protein [Fortiea contorta]